MPFEVLRLYLLTSCLFPFPSFLPSNDRNEWYYPAARQPAEEIEEIIDDDDRSEEALLASRSGQGNWGNKLVKGSRWMRRGKIVAWGPRKSDWDVSSPLYFQNNSSTLFQLLSYNLLIVLADGRQGPETTKKGDA